jgi:hypothetical protein
MSDAAPRPFPPMVPLMFCAAIITGVLSAGVGYATPIVFVLAGMSAGSAGVVVAVLVMLVVLGLVVGGVDAALTRQPGVVARAVLTVLAVGLVIAAKSFLMLKGAGYSPTGWWVLVALAGVTGFGAALVVTRRLAPVIVGVAALLLVGAVLVSDLQQATAGNVYPPYVAPGS